jgi:serine/threonine protein phosphatase PrpC
MIQFAAGTHTGLRRSRNEDSYEADQELGLWLVADGVGGHACGDVASAIVKAEVHKQVLEGASLVDAIMHAHAAVLKEIARRGSDTRMGTTVVALSIQYTRWSLAWVGDSRAYLLDGGQLRQLTRDHSHVRDLVDRGLLAPAAVATHPDRHALTQSMGISSEMKPEPGFMQGDWQQGQQVLLCSDGLTDELNDDSIRQILLDKGAAQAQVDGLVDAALEAGGRDNITVIVVGAGRGETADTVPNNTNRTPRINWIVPAILLGLAALSILLWNGS